MCMQFADHRMYAIQILATVVVSGSTAVLIKLLYDPLQPFTSSLKRRSVGQSASSDELCLLLCAHSEHDASPLIALLDIALPSPTCAYLLHLLPLVGHANSMLAPYVPKRRRPCLTDYIVNAFSILEYNHRGRLTIIPFFAVSPYSSMYSDVCQLALDKKAALVILPFHKHKDPETGVVSVDPSVRAMNINVLHYSPCSVAIFISNGISNGTHLLRSVAVFFLGGTDDREALAFASRMAHNPGVGLNVIRLVLPQGLRRTVEENEEERLDEEAMAEFRTVHGENKRVDYREKELSEGAEMIKVVREASTEYSLVVVGRREGEQSRLTEGMEMWNEYPELGVVGDVLASTDLGGSMSTLVVQRRPRSLKGK